MVAEPPQNEGEPHPSKDELSNNLVLPQRGDLAKADHQQQQQQQHRNSSRRNSCPTYNGTQLQTPSISSASSSSSSLPHTSSSPSTSTTASSVCDTKSGDHASPETPGTPGPCQHHLLLQQKVSPSCSSSSPPSAEGSPHHQNTEAAAAAAELQTNLDHHSSCSRDKVPPLQLPCIRNQHPSDNSSSPPSSEQMTEASSLQQQRPREKETTTMSSCPHTKIIVTPEDEEGDGHGGGGRRRLRNRSRENNPSSVVEGIQVGVPKGIRNNQREDNGQDDLEVHAHAPQGVREGDGSSSVVRRNSCGSVNSINHSSSKHSIGKVCEGQVWVRGGGGTLPDLSEFERVWEAAPEVIIKPATLASSETLTPTEALTPTPTHTLDSLAEAHSVTSDPSAFHDPQENIQNEVPDQDTNSPGSDWPSCGDELVVGAVGGGGHACGCGIEMDVLDGTCGRCPSCPAPAEVYVSEQFPSSDPLECVDGSTHTLHVDLSTGEVQLHMNMSDPEKGPPPPPLTGPPPPPPHHHHHHLPPLPPPPPVPPTSVPGDPTKCLHDPCSMGPPPTTSHDPGAQPVKKAFTFSSGIGEASVYHALVVIFLEFFAWGLLTAPMISVLNETFPDHTFLMNGLIVGIKGILSFLSAPLIGALSDLWGRKFFLFITVFFTCLPIPFMKINTWWYFALISMSGVFAVTFSIVFAYVADVTDVHERSSAYGLVSATFAASLVTSPALGAYLGKVHSDDLVVGLATAIAVLDVFFILVAVPESLPEKLRLSSSWSAHISWEQADPFSALWKVSKDRNVLLISVSVFLSYLPEAGQYSCFFVYLRLVMDFTAELVATFIAVVGILSVVAQTALLSLLMKKLSNKHVIIVGLVFEMLQLMWYGFGSKMWMMWAAGLLAAVSSITYPAISSYVSTHTDVDKQGVVQGIITGMRGLCSGLGPAMFGFIFYLFHVDLNTDHADDGLHRPNGSSIGNGTTPHIISSPNLVPGPPFVFGALLVICALMVAAFIPEGQEKTLSKSRKQSGASLDMSYERGHKKNDSLDAASLPLMDETDVL